MRRQSKQSARVIAVAGILLSLIAGQAQAGLIEDINRLRTRGCGNHPAAPTTLRSSRALDEVARKWSRGGRLRQALDRLKFPVTTSASMRVEGGTNDATILNVLASNYCAAISGREYSDIGMFRRGRNVWIVVATPLTPPAMHDASRIGAEVLSLVNQARSEGRRCGSTSFAAAPTLTLSAGLTRAALMQAQDMAAHRNFEHTGTDGSTPSQRVTRAGYRWRSVAENIALGPTTAQQVTQGWLDSPGHCANIMSPHSTEMGLAFAVNPDDRGDIYWAQVFATPM